MAAEGEWVGEVVFNTSMCGYQEIITDPSYWGQMVVFTCPHIGNVGVNAEDVESAKPYVRAVLARQICTHPSNWRAEQSLREYLLDNGVPALSGLDTRRLTLTLREKGALRGALSTVSSDPERLHQMALSAPDMSTLSPQQELARSGREEWTMPVSGRWVANLDHQITERQRAPHVVVIDCGLKYNILRYLVGFGARVTVVPADSTVERILAERPDGALISNGPGDPEQWPETIVTVRGLMERMPLFGLCLGHQLIALAGGACTYKLPFGHHGGNHPVQELASGRVEITAQNHNYAVAADSLDGLPFEVTRVNLYDGTIEGLCHLHRPIQTVQYHPEASPGPHDSLQTLHQFVNSLIEPGE